MSTFETESPVTALQTTLITAQEFRRILKIAGYTHEDFAHHIHRSRSHLGNLASGASPLTLRIIEQLRYFMGANMYEQALSLARRSITEEEHRRQERMEAIRRERAERDAQEAAARERCRQKAAEKLQSGSNPA